MTYPGRFLRLVAAGRLLTTESWSWSLSLIPSGAGGASRPTEVPTAVRSAVSTFHTAVSTAPALLDEVKLNEIGPDGRYTQESTVLHEFVPGVAPGTSLMNAPQIALAVSLESGARRGLAARGRFYIPIPVAGPSTSEGGRITTTQATNVANAATTMIEAINAALPGYRVGIASDVREGRFREVRNVRVGRVLDTIRSRRTSLDEGYVEGAVISDFGGGGGSF